jgi:hypothetical protein
VAVFPTYALNLLWASTYGGISEPDKRWMSLFALWPQERNAKRAMAQYTERWVIVIGISLNEKTYLYDIELFIRGVAKCTLVLPSFHSGNMGEYKERMRALEFPVGHWPAKESALLSHNGFRAVTTTALTLETIAVIEVWSLIVA